MFDEEHPDEIEVQAEPLEPAYAVLENERETNISCSGSSGRDFCFLCSYSGNETEQLQQYIDSLVQSGRELHTIAGAVHKVYNESFKDKCVHVYNKIKIEKPEWTIERIKRHLLFQGGTESGVFEQYVTKTLEHVIIKSNKICTSAGDIDEDKRKALMNSIDTLIRWRTHVKDHKAGKKKGR